MIIDEQINTFVLIFLSGCLCIGRFNDGSLYRVRLLDIDVDTVSMFFIGDVHRTQVDLPQQA